MSKPSYQILPASPDDVPAILEMIRELAVFEKLEHQVVATGERYHRALFGDPPQAEALIAKVGEQRVGYAIFFTTFSTFIGKSGLWLEDLYVREAYRGTGIGKAMLKAGAVMARDRGCDRYEWCVLDWNQKAIDLYEAVGADVMPDWRICRMDRDGIEAMGE